MSEEKKAGAVKKIFDKIRAANSDEHSAKSDNNARLGYDKGNIDQLKPKNTDVWDTCPVLDETGKPLQEE